MIYCEVEGSFLVPANTIIHAPCLRHVGRHFYTKSEKQVYLPNLVSVGGDFDALRCLWLQAPRLKKVGGNAFVIGKALSALKTVGGRYWMRWAFEVNVPNLVHVGGAFDLHKCFEIIAPNLEVVGGNLLTKHPAKKLHMPALTSVGGDFLAGSVAELHAPKLRSVGGEMDTRSAEGFFRSYIHVGGDWSAFPGTKEIWLRNYAARLVIRGDGILQL